MSAIKIHLKAGTASQMTKKRPQVSLLLYGIQSEEILDVTIYSILCDEATDISHNKQTSLVVWYVHEMEIKERFIQMCDVESTIGQKRT